MIDEGMSGVPVVLMTAVVLILVIFFGLRSRYVRKPLRRGRHAAHEPAKNFLPHQAQQ